MVVSNGPGWEKILMKKVINSVVRRWKKYADGREGLGPGESLLFVREDSFVWGSVENRKG